jgi:hypothetical protein
MEKRHTRGGSMEEYRWFRIAASVFAVVVLAPFLALALLPLTVVGAPLFLALLLPVVLTSAATSR